MKSILLSMRPEHAVNVLNGKKTLELRTNIPKDLLEIIKQYGGIWVYIYVSKGNGNQYLGELPMWDCFEIVSKEAYDRMVYINKYKPYSYENECRDFDLDNILNQKVVARFWLDEYNWHIKNLEIFDEPKELKEFYTYKTKTIYSGLDCPPYVDEVKKQVSRAPQSWMFVYVKENL